MAISTGHHCHLQVLTIFPLLRDQTVCNDGQDLFLWVMCGGWECRMQTKPKHRALLPSVKKLNILANYVQTTSAHKPERSSPPASLAPSSTTNLSRASPF